VTGYLLDTNVISELRKGARADAHVRRWYGGLGDDEVFLSVLVIGEIRRGVESIRRRDEPAARALDRWLAGLVRDHGDRILAVDEAIAQEWGRLGSAATLPTVDGLLAATAAVHDLVVATRNVRDLARTGVAVVNPFAAG
jgi:predicted nucleic acid-binding protein